MERKALVGISAAPTDPEQKKMWVDSMMRIQIAMWLDSRATCEHCGHEYSSIEDFKEKSPRRGYGDKFSFVCSPCWDSYDLKRILKQAKTTKGGKC